MRLVECHWHGNYDDGTPYYRCCDWCSYAAYHDLWDGVRDEARWRKFFLSSDGLTTCSHCLEALDEVSDRAAVRALRLAAEEDAAGWGVLGDFLAERYGINLEVAAR